MCVSCWHHCDAGGITAISRGLSVATPPESNNLAFTPEGDCNVRLQRDLAGIHSGMQFLC